MASESTEMCYFQVTDEAIPEVVDEEDKEAGNQQPEKKSGETTGGNIKSTNTSFKQLNTGYARSRQANTPILKESVAVMGDIQAKANEKTTRDDCSVFGEHVANKIRKLSNPLVQATVQHLICNTLFDAEMGKFDQPPRM